MTRGSLRPSWIIRITPARTCSLHMHRAANAAGVAEHAQIALHFGWAAGGFFRIVRELYRGPPVDRGHLADDRDRIEVAGTIRRAADKIIGQVGAPAETDSDAAGKMPV